VNRDLALDIATNFIAGEEGFVGHAYPDAGSLAIGYGNHYYEDGSPVQEGDIIDRTRGWNLLRKVSGEKMDAITPYIHVDLNENQLAALTSLAYNCGEGNERKSTLLQEINDSYSAEDIEAQFEKTCVTSQGKYLQDLYNRRVHEMTLFFTNAESFARKNPKTTIAIVAGSVAFAGAMVFYFYKLSKAK